MSPTPDLNSIGTLMCSRALLAGRGRVGWLYREPPVDDVDSGWRLFAGSEDPEEIVALDVCAPSEVAAFDPAIASVLDAPVGSAFERIPDTDEFSESDDSESDDA